MITIAMANTVITNKLGDSAFFNVQMIDESTTIVKIHIFSTYYLQRDMQVGMLLMNVFTKRLNSLFRLHFAVISVYFYMIITHVQ